jgi:hypothetical protein
MLKRFVEFIVYNGEHDRENKPCGRERLVLDPVFLLLYLSCTQRLAYTVC